MPVNDAPTDDEVRETYNFPPGAYGIVYRADVPDSGLLEEVDQSEDAAVLNEQASDSDAEVPDQHAESSSINYQLKAMKWGLIPFWTKRSPNYSSMMRTINCRDDSLIENRGMWNTMKQRKRCIVIAQGFYEWLKKGPGGKDKIPHFVKRKDGNLMCFAGLWDCVKYEDAEDKLYTYSIITTDSNKQLKFLHDRMPVILEPNSDSMKLWLDPTKKKWTKDLQSMLKPYEGELDCYPVNKDVGKVGNNSPDFIVPIDSKENKKNIANFFEIAANKSASSKASQLVSDDGATADHKSTEIHAPMPTPKNEKPGAKRKRGNEEVDTAAKFKKTSKTSTEPSSPLKPGSTNKTRSAVSNEASTLKSGPIKKYEAGTQKITNFFVK